MIAAAVMLIATIAAATVPSDVPPIEDCDAIIVHRSQEPWLRIIRDGSATIGIGALMPHATVGAGTFDFAAVYAALSGQLMETRRNAELPYVSVGFHRRGAPAVRMYYVDDERLISRLFSEANRHARPE